MKKIMYAQSNKVKVSICMATFNGALYLPGQIDSIVSQMGVYDELVVVDDASSDGTVAYLNSLGDPRVRVFINSCNIGHVQTFSKAIGLARGNYIFLADQDDIWIDGRLGAMRAVLEAGSGLVSTNTSFISTNGQVIDPPRCPARLKEEFSDNFLLNIMRIFAGNAFYFGCAMAFRQELRRIILPIPSYVESHDLWIAMAANLARSNYHLSQNTLQRRIHDNNVSVVSRSFVKKLKSRIILLISLVNIAFRVIRGFSGFDLSRPYQICSQCVMDTTDPNIIFDSEGRCDYCNNFRKKIKPYFVTSLNGNTSLTKMIADIKKDGVGKDFDCIIGLSGGLDSSYVAYIAKEKMGLRPLLFHVDAGWNTDQAVGNIEKLVDGLGLELYTDVVNWEAVKRMQVAFLRSGIPDQDLVQDAVFFSGLYRFAKKHKIKHIITGSNFSTECCREPEEWGGYLGIDKTLFGDIWAKCGDGQPNDEFPLIDILVYKLWYQKVLKMKVHHPLNLVPFVKNDAEDELERRFGWQRFQHKHHESRFTRFYEDYWLPRRFGYEKRRAHFSSLIMAGQMTRDQALDRISRPEMDEHFLKQEFEYVAHKLGLTVDELQQLFDMPKRTYRDFKNKRGLIGIGSYFMRKLGLEKRYFR